MTTLPQPWDAVAVALAQAPVDEPEIENADRGYQPVGISEVGDGGANTNAAPPSS